MASSAAIATVIAGVVMIAAAMKLDAIEKLRELGAGVAAYPPYMVAAGGLLVVVAVIAATLRARLAVTTRIALIAFANVVALQTLLVGAHVFDAYFSAEKSVDTFVGEGQSFPAKPPFYSVGMLDQSVPFYLERTLTQVEHKGELANGIAAEPEKFIEEMSTFEAQWRALDEAYAVMPPKTYGELKAAGLPMTVMAVDPRRVFVAARTLAAGRGDGPDEKRRSALRRRPRRERPR